MTSDNLQQWIRHPEMLNKETLYELRTLLARYPYFQTLRLLYLKNLFLLHDITFGAELRKSALYVADRRTLFYLIEGDKYILRSFKKGTPSIEVEEELCLDRTLALIDSFLLTVPEETAQTTLDYSTDYTSYLLHDNDVENTAIEGFSMETPRLRGSELIDGFIEKSEGELSSKIKTLPRELPDLIETENFSLEETNIEEEEDDSCFTETLAKIYVKQQRYSKALEIIKKLSLKYPKKNAYFADQIRFLEKLIINANSK